MDMEEGVIHKASDTTTTELPGVASVTPSASSSGMGTKFSVLKTGLIQMLDSHESTVDNLQSQLNNLKTQGSEMKKFLGVLDELEQDHAKMNQVMESFDSLRQSWMGK